MNSAGILRTIAQMDYIFAPVSADKAVLESTLSFLDVLQRMMLGKETSRLKGLYLSGTKSTSGKRAGCTRSTGRWSPTWDCRCCKPASPTRTLPQGGGRHGRVVFRSTLLAPDRRMLAGSGIPELTREIVDVLKLEGYEETAE